MNCSKLLILVALCCVTLACEFEDNRDTIKTGGHDLQAGDCDDRNGGVEACGEGEVCMHGECVPSQDGCVNDDDCANPDAHCDGDSRTCIEPVCDDPPNACRRGQIIDRRCDYSEVIEDCCVNDDDCGDTEVCVNNACEPVPNCVDDAADCVVTAPANHECGNTPIPGCCAGDGDCPDGSVCDGGTQECTECVVDNDCDDNPDGGICEANTCVECRGDAQCDDDSVCTDGFCEEVPCEEDGNVCTREEILQRECAHSLIVDCCNGSDQCAPNQFCRLESQDPAVPNNACVQLACDDGEVCTQDLIANHACNNPPIAGCCDGQFQDDGVTPQCNGNVCNEQTNRCVECVESATCGEGLGCVDSQCVQIDCGAPQEVCTEEVFNDATKACERLDIMDCCSGPADDSDCYRPCNDAADCRNNEQCGPHTVDFDVDGDGVTELVTICVQQNLPRGYLMGCQTGAVQDENNSCTTCSDFDADGRCATLEVCGNGFDDNGDGYTDQNGNPDNILVVFDGNGQPDPSIHCVECNTDDNCQNGQVCSLELYTCVDPPVVCEGDVDCNGDEVCEDNACVAPPGPPVDDDADNDGVLDANDNCVNDANANQADLDQDGIGDVCDSDVDGDGDQNDTDCAPRDDQIFNGQNEVCDGIDNDCDTVVDDGGDNLCQNGQVCNNAAGCEDPPVECVPDCGNMVCGNNNDGCGGSCGNCVNGLSCDATGQCVVNEEPGRLICTWNGSRDVIPADQGFDSVNLLAVCRSGGGAPTLGWRIHDSIIVDLDNGEEFPEGISLTFSGVVNLTAQCDLNVGVFSSGNEQLEFWAARITGRGQQVADGTTSCRYVRDDGTVVENNDLPVGDNGLGGLNFTFDANP